MLEVTLVFSFSLMFGVNLYKAYADLKSSKQIKAYSNMTKPIYDFNDRL
jgi:hypothetical protein